MYLEATVCTNGECSFWFSGGRGYLFEDIAEIPDNETAKGEEETDEADEAGDDEDYEEEISDYSCIAGTEKEHWIDWDDVRYGVHESLEDAFWESMNDNPEWGIIELLKETPEYPGLKDMPEEEFDEFISAFVKNAVGTSETTYEMDGYDVTDLIGSQPGEWDDQIFSQMMYSVMYQLEKIFQGQK